MLSLEDINSFIELQLSQWYLAKNNYDNLIKVKRRYVKVCDVEIGIQWNPGRIVSTAAKVDTESIINRKCFLCKVNRDKHQLSIRMFDNWELLVNPYPIFPTHLTIASKDHAPQSRVPYDIVRFAENLPGLCVFFNGAKSGASAPDHLHMQAVLKDEIPLISIAERFHKDSESGIKFSSDFGVSLPFFFVSGVVSPDSAGLSTMKFGLDLGGIDSNDEFKDLSLVNCFFWLSNNGLLRFISIPRRTHRPKCFFSNNSDYRMISPGSIDMGGLIITPREEDFNLLTSSDIEKIYSDVAVANDCVYH